MGLTLLVDIKIGGVKVRGPVDNYLEICTSQDLTSSSTSDSHYRNKQQRNSGSHI